MVEFTGNEGVVKAGDVFPCFYCGSPLLAGDGATVTCDVCMKVSAKAGAVSWSVQHMRESVDLALVNAPMAQEVRSSRLLAQPRTVVIERDGSELQLRYRPSWGKRLVTAVIALASAAMTLEATQGMAGSAAHADQFRTFGLIAAAWTVLSILTVPFRTVVLTASARGLEVRHSLGLRTTRYERSALLQLYCELRTVTRRGESSITQYCLCAQMGDQSAVVLAVLPEAESALYLERELERALGILDTPVNLETGRSTLETSAVT
jgi:hypothetical protein